MSIRRSRNWRAPGADHLDGGIGLHAVGAANPAAIPERSRRHGHVSVRHAELDPGAPPAVAMPPRISALPPDFFLG